MATEHKNNQLLSGQTAVITGAASGIGRAIAIELAAAGAACLVHARQNEQGAADVVEQIRDTGGVAEYTLIDLGDSDGPSRLVEHAWNWRDGVDVWVNNAGADVITGDAADLDFDAKLELLWRVDVRAMISIGREVGQRMKQRGHGV
ncbi:MAG: SDR family NAD(P)-dependent oxidoreductase, partial [Pirellulales bacterium]|nr:SDR family NAD(P)-dependent oxidoreductase [Pirellulales bacterium]